MHSHHLPSFLRHAGCALVLFLATALQAAPIISNLSAVQRPGTKLVDIRYDLDGGGFATLAVRLQVSSNGGSTWTVPATTVSGAIGNNVTPGVGRVIVWNAGADWPGGYSTQMRFRVIADDQVVPLEGFSFIPAGSFTMGAVSGDREPDSPSITVTVSGFYMQQTETTWERWKEIRSWASNNGYTDLDIGNGVSDNHPVIRISWESVIKWCNARSEKEKLTPVYTLGGMVFRDGYSDESLEANWSANGYRLPTEAEWEKAARGGVAGKRFPWGTDTISHSQANFKKGDPPNDYEVGTVGWHPNYYTLFNVYTCPVRSFPANDYGLYEMGGNVKELCWDAYSSSYYSLSNGSSDPRGPAIILSDRVVRGGDWNYDGSFCRNSYRQKSGGLTSGSSYTGFRPVRITRP